MKYKKKAPNSVKRQVEMEQDSVELERVRSCGLPTAENRQRGCIEELIQSLQSLGTWGLTRFFGEPSASGIQNHQPMENSDNVVNEVIKTQPHSNNPNAFNTARNVLACDDNVNTDANEGTCTTEQNDAINLMKDLTLDQLAAVINNVQEHLDREEQGAGPALSVNTGNHDLNDFINFNPELAIDMLNNAMKIASASNVKPKRRAKKGKNRQDNVLTGAGSNGNAEIDTDDVFQLVTNLRKRTNKKPKVALQTGGQYFTRSSDSPNFNTMINKFNHSMNSSRMGINDLKIHTWAIANDGEAAGSDRRFVVLSDANNGRNGERAGFGLEHIWTKKQGGHQDDFMLRGINNRDMLARMIMAALASTAGRPQITTRTGEGGQRRLYAAVTFESAGSNYLFTNVVIVVGIDGFVITAFPTKNSTLSLLS